MEPVQSNLVTQVIFQRVINQHCRGVAKFIRTSKRIERIENQLEVFKRLEKFFRVDF